MANGYIINPNREDVIHLMKMNDELRIVIRADGETAIGTSFDFDHWNLGDALGIKDITKSKDVAACGFIIKEAGRIAYKQTTQDNLMAKDVLTGIGFNYTNGVLN